MDMVYKLYLDQTISSTGFGERYKPLEEQQKQLGDKIPELQAEIDYLKIQYLSSDQILQEARDLYTRWPQLTEEHKRSIVENITDRIIIGKEDISINLAYLPTSSEMMTDRQHNDMGSSQQPA
jgi:site-specific DNA recombinase